MLSITIATYNRSHLLEKSLIALSKQSLSPDKFEIIICDSYSQDSTQSMIESFCITHPQMTIKHLHTDNVLASKRNLGIRSAKGEVVIFFDDDCIADLNCLETYYNIFKTTNDPKVVYCGEVRFPKEWVTNSNYYRFRDSRHFGPSMRKDIVSINFKTIVVMNMAFRKTEFITHVGEVNESFIGYGCEDQDLGWRLEAAGFELRKCNARILHYEESGSIDGYSKKIFHTARDGSVTLLKQNPPAFKAIRSLKLVDKAYPFDSRLERVLYTFFRHLLFQQPIGNFLTNILTKNDSNKAFYFPLFYRYIMACAYIQGTNQRGKNAPQRNNWYN